MLWTVKDVANILRVNKKTVYAMLHDGKLKYLRIGSMIRIESADLDEFMRGKDVNCTDDTAA